MKILNRNKKAMSATEQVMLLVVLVVVALILIWMAREYLMERGGAATEALIKGVNDFDGDGIRNNVDRCKPAACDPGDSPVDTESTSLRYGCAEHQGITLSLYADTCNPLETATPPAAS